jgi:hypothetical protein
MDTTTYVEKTDPEEHQMKQPPPGVSGWGVDLDPADRPAYPKERTPPRWRDCTGTNPSSRR